MKKAILFFLLCSLIIAQAYSLEIRGRIISAARHPISGVVIVHRESGKQALTDGSGFFSLTLPETERVKLECIHPDYMEQEVSFPAKELLRPVTITLTPYIRQREEVVVTAMRYPELSAKVPAAGAVITAETLEEKMAANVVEALAGLTGVSSIGSGGFSLVPSVRGLARRRVLLMVDNARLFSDRRTGPSASFISPEDIGKIEVLRSPSSVFYGSDAIGGAVNILTREPESQQALRGKINAKFGTVNQEKGLGFSLSGTKSHLGYYFSLQGVDAENYNSPRGEVLQSQFTQSNFLGKLRYQTEKREVEGEFLLARGRNIGKPIKDSATKPTWYPQENQNLAQFRWREKGIWGDADFSFSLFANPNFLETKSETITTYKAKESYSKTESTDFGSQISLAKKIGSSFRLTAGADFYGRQSAEAMNTDTSYDDQGRVTNTFKETPYSNGSRRDLGVFISGDFDGFKNFDLVSGIRLDFLSTQANPGGGAEIAKSNNQALTGFIASSVKLAEKVVFFANFSRAYRAPDLNELYYTGVTGRGFIIANPDLKPEASFSLDTGLKFIGKRFFGGLYGFIYEIKDMIERYRVAEKTYTYGNIEKGRIQGLELETEYFPLSGWSVFGNFTLIQGRSRQTNAPLNDIPAHRLFLGSRVWLGRFSFEASGAAQAKIENPGPAEVAIPSAQYVNLKVTYFAAPGFAVHFLFSNVFNETFYARPDPDAREEPGRNLVFSVSYAF